ncbi:MAG: hypothetical protein AB8B69_15915 [Chitinophagales bacterium]
MQPTKITRTLSKGQSKSTENAWKDKAISRRKDKAALLQRIKELEASRDNWKQKYQLLKKTGVKSASLSIEKASKHQYSLSVVTLIIELYKYGGMSLRSCRHSLCCMLQCFGLTSRVPSHSSIRNWLCKCGIYRVKKNSDKSGKYVIYVDESITFGSEKMLLILGVPVERIRKDRALSHEDMSVLYVGASQEWKGEHIADELQEIATHHEVEYVVSDEGTNLRKAYKTLNYTHVEDCTHILAKYLKRIYEKDADFEAFRKLIGKLRRDWNLSKTKSQYMPPTMRGKMRFANIFPCVNWAKKTLANWDSLDGEVQNRLTFLKENTDFIQSLIEVEIVFKKVCAQLKNQGFQAAQKQEILDSFIAMKAGEKASVFIENCKDYLENLTMKSEVLKRNFLLCSSDIIESYFGKFKTKVNPNNRSGLTEFIFTIATFGKHFSLEETRLALESIKCKDLKLVKKRASSA